MVKQNLKNMLIGELSKRSGVSRDTIRFYEKLGLIRVGKKDRRENNYKEYSEEILQRLNTINRIKAMGFTLNEVLDLIEIAATNSANCDTVSSRITAKVIDIDQRIRELHQLKRQMLETVSSCEGYCSPQRNTIHCPLLA